MVPTTIAIQIFAACHISYCKRRYEKEDNTVYSIQIRPERNPDESNAINSNPASKPLRLNTNNYNEILFEATTMIMGAATLFMALMILFWATSLSKSNGMWVYLCNDVWVFIFNVITPCSFYTFNRNARMYIKSLILSR